MIREQFKESLRTNKRIGIKAEFVVVGGGVAGICAAITAARRGIKD